MRTAPIIALWFKLPNIGDRAASLFVARGQPMAAEEVQAAVGVVRSLGSLKNALSSDGRFVRVNPNSWALRQWGLSEYKPIRQLIGDELDSSDGEIALAELIDILTTRFTIKASSVVTYANSHPFEVVKGIVRSGRTANQSHGHIDPFATPHLFRHESAWALRTRISNEHLRGSGTPVPAGLASALGLYPGESVGLQSPSGKQHVRWNGAQPTLGSIRRLLTEANEDDEVFLVFSDSREFRLQRLRDGARGIDGICAEMGLPQSEVSGSMKCLAMAIGLRTDSTRSDLVAALIARRDLELAALLEGL